MFKIIFSLIMSLVCTTQGCISDEDPHGVALGVGDTLPEFSVTMNNGEAVTTPGLIGKVSMIVFFNTNCGDCQKELPIVQEVWQYYQGNSNIVIAPIAREEGNDEILKYWEENGLSMPYAPQENREIYSLFAPSVIPRIYIANTKGVITAAFGDKNMPDYATIVSAIEEARFTSTQYQQ